VKLIAFVGFGLLAVAARAGAGDAAGRDALWPAFRGPHARGAAEGEGLPLRWSKTENVAWSTPLGGRGWSSPIVWGGRVFVTTAVSEGEDVEPKKGLYFGGERSEPLPDEHRWVVICLDAASGKIRWEATAHKARPSAAIHIKNTYASETPVADGERVYAYFGNVGLFAYDHDGQKLWERRWDAVKTRYGWGLAASPVLHGEHIYIVNDNEDRSFLVAVDRKSGNEVWRVERDEKSNWSTPFVWENGARVEIVTPGSGKVRSYSLDGKLLWELKGMSKITIATPYAVDGLLYVTSGFVMDSQRPVYAIRPGAEGDISLVRGETSNRHIAWSQPRAAPYNPSTLVYAGRLYVLLDQGFLACYDARTGAEVFGRQRLDRDAGAFTASPWAYGGKVFCLSEDGDTFVVEAGAGETGTSFKLVGVNRLEEMCMACPAIAGRTLFIRTLSRLYAIRER
jgi:outer membrane protein assembly factor BamB